MKMNIYNKKLNVIIYSFIIEFLIKVKCYPQITIYILLQMRRKRKKVIKV